MVDDYSAFSAYVPEDRLAQISGGPAVDGRSYGAVLFADVVGFTTLTSHLARLLGPRRGAEEVPVYLNRLYDVLIGEAQAHGGSVIGFAGDAITCWFAGDDGRVAAACGLAMQRRMEPFERLDLPGASGTEGISLALKVAVTAGKVRRFVVGDPTIQLVDVIAGGPVAQIESLEAHARRGRVVVGSEVAATLGFPTQFVPPEAWLGAKVQGAGLEHLNTRADHGSVGWRTGTEAQAGLEALTPWLLPTVRRRLSSGGGDFLTELRPVAALFLSFSGIDIDSDDDAATKFGRVVQGAQQVAREYGGNVLQVTSGDKGNYLYMAFGAPVSHEDDVQRCAAASLDLRPELLRLPFLTHLSIGLGYGTARTGAYGSGARRTYGALGEGTNMAARMMSSAPHARIYASGAFADALGGGFQLVQIGDLRVKGRAEPARAFELTARATGGRAAPPAQLRPLRGREAESELLRSHIAAAASGHGCTVQLVAEAGMGKTELLRHALANQQNELWVVNGACQAFGRTAPYQLWKSVFHQLLNIAENRPAAERTVGAQRALADIDAALTSQAHLLAPVLELPLESSQITEAQDAEERGAARRKLLLTLFRHVARQSAERGLTLVLVLEDLHWLDPASEELLWAVGQAASALPVLLITSARPPEPSETAARGTLAGASIVELGPLEPSVARELVAERLAESEHLSDHVDALTGPIVERADGNPFYLQELVTDMVQRAEHQGSGVGLAGDLPTTVHSLILARLDRLEDAHLVNLKVASIVGREFRTAWTAACQPGVSEAVSEAAFRATDQAGLTRRLMQAPSSHEFNHAITHEVAYDSQPHADRSRLHTVLARFVEQEVATSEEPHLDLLAYHYALGQDPGRARYYLAAAGAAAKAAYANQAALDYFGRLLALQEGEQRLPTLLELGEVASFVGEYGKAEGHLVGALELSERGSNLALNVVALRLLGELAERQGEHAKARTRLEEAASLCRRLVAEAEHAREVGPKADLSGAPGAVAEPASAPVAQAELTRVLLALGGNVLWHLGEYDAAEAQLEEAIQLARAAGDIRAAARALHGRANIYLYRGQADEAEAAFSESLAMRRDAQDEYGVANALNNLAIVYANAGDGARAEELFLESLTIRQRLGDASGVAVALNNLGYMAAERDDLASARRLYEESLGARRELGDRLGLAVSLNNLAGLVLGLGDAEEARGHYLESVRLACGIDNRREAAAALAGLANAVQDDAAGARLAWVAEGLLEQLGAAADDEVRAHIEQGKARVNLGREAADEANATMPADRPGTEGAAGSDRGNLTRAPTLPDLASMTLSEVVDWALQGA